MPSFSETSLRRLHTCDDMLIHLFREVVRHYDCKVTCGYRDAVAQEEAFEGGFSPHHYPDSLHNRRPSLAVDVVPYPVDWDDFERFLVFGGFVLGVAARTGTPLRWGGDWDGDWDLRDQKLRDLPHFELVR